MPSRAESLRRHVALARAVVRARRRPFDPFKLTWILTERCSLRCGTCHLWASPEEGPDLETVCRVLDANRHLTWLNLSGGDLVERPDAPELLAETVARLPDLALLDFPTAGQDPDATLAALEPVLASDVPRVYVTVSLDGPDETHDRVRRTSGSAARARETLRRLQAVRRPGFEVVAGMTLSSHNLPEAVPARPDALLPPDVAPDRLHLNLAHHSAHYYRNREDVRPPVETALAVLDAAKRRAAAAAPPWERWTPLGLVERRYWTLARRYLRDGSLEGRCGALRASVYLGADLTVYPCSVYDRPLGRLDEVGYALRRLPQLAEAAGALADVEARACPGCWSPCEAFPTLLVGLGKTL